MLIQKNKEYIVDIIDNGFEGEGIAKIDNFTIFIQGAIKGEKVKILIIKVLSSYAIGKIIEILDKCEYRVEEDCLTYKRCGGCNLRHIQYNETLNIKQDIVQNLANKTLINKVKVNKTIGMGNPYNYRNKTQYPIGFDNKGNSAIGIYAKRSHEIISIKNCEIQNIESQNIAKYIFNFIKENDLDVYNEKTSEGIFRHIVTKIGVQTNEMMVILVLNKKEFPKEKELVSNLLKEFPNIKTIVKNINMKNTNVILGSENINLYGDGYIYDLLGKYKFKISPLSFYQINPIQTECLYNVAIEYAKLTGKETIFDLYCGIGTIGIFASKKAKKVYGIEIIPDAIKDAKENSKINNVENAEFYVGQVEDILPKLIKEKNISADVVFLDPPRKGCDKKTLDTLMKTKPEKIIYISCNPATLVRDLKILEELYEIKEIQPVDMFPYTTHVECVVLLGLRGNDKTQ